MHHAMMALIIVLNPGFLVTAAAVFESAKIHHEDTK